MPPIKTPTNNRLMPRIIYQPGVDTLRDQRRLMTDTEWKYFPISLYVEDAPMASAALSTYFEPVTNGDADFPEILFHDGDVVMHEVPL